MFIYSTYTLCAGIDWAAGVLVYSGGGPRGGGADGAEGLKYDKHIFITGDKETICDANKKLLAAQTY